MVVMVVTMMMVGAGECRGCRRHEDHGKQGQGNLLHVSFQSRCPEEYNATFCVPPWPPSTGQRHDRDVHWLQLRRIFDLAVL